MPNMRISEKAKGQLAEMTEFGKSLGSTAEPIIDEAYKKWKKENRK